MKDHISWCISIQAGTETKLTEHGWMIAPYISNVDESMKIWASRLIMSCPTPVAVLSSTFLICKRTVTHIYHIIMMLSLQYVPWALKIYVQLSYSHQRKTFYNCLRIQWQHWHKTTWTTTLITLFHVATHLHESSKLSPIGIIWMWLHKTVHDQPTSFFNLQWEVHYHQWTFTCTT